MALIGQIYTGGKLDKSSLKILELHLGFIELKFAVTCVGWEDEPNSIRYR